MPNDQDADPADDTTDATTDEAATEGSDASADGEPEAPAVAAAPVKAKRKAPAKKAAAKKAVREVPADARILDYSTKATFEVGQWVRHPTFGVGYVVEAGPYVTLEIGELRKVLAHVPAPTSTAPIRARTLKSSGDTLELARAQGVEIKKMPPRFDGEK